MAEKKYLDYDGLLYVKGKLQDKFDKKVDKADGKGLSTNDYTTAEKNKLAGLSNYTLPVASDSVLGGVKIGSGVNVDANGVITVTHYDDTDIKSQISNKVDKADGKGLSTNDYTTAEKNKLAELNNYTLPTASATTKGGVKIGSGVNINDDGAISVPTYTLPKASATVLGGIKVGAGLSIDEGGLLNATQGGKADSVDWSGVLNKPTKVSDFTNDSKFQTESQVSSSIANAIKDITSISYSVVTSLPTTGEAGVIYLVADTHSDKNDIYDEYIYVNSKFEKLGNTDIDLSGYTKSGDLVAITNDEIDTIFA